MGMGAVCRALVITLLLGLSVGCHAAKDDPVGQAKELADPVRRENAIYNIQELYTRALADNNGDRNSEAVKALADAVVEPLSQAYIDYPEDRTNGLAILAVLSETQDARALPALVEALNWRTEVSEEHAVRAAQTLQAIDVPAGEQAAVVDALGKALERIDGNRVADNKMRIAMIRALGALRHKSSGKILTMLATKQDPNQNFMINRLAAQQLGELGDPSAVPALIQCLFLYAPERPGMRMNDVAAEALVRIGRPALQPLLNLLAGKDEAANRIAGAYVDEVRKLNPRASVTVAQVIGGEATYALGALGFKEALQPLLDEAQDSDPVRKLNASIALMRLDVDESQDRQVRSALEQAFDKMPRNAVGMREQLLAAMAHTYDPQVIPFIRSQLRDRSQHPALRLIAAQYLAQLADKSDAEAFRDTIKSEDEGYKRNLEEYEPLLKVAEECDSSVPCWLKKAGAADPKVARKASYMLGRFGGGNPKAVDALVNLLGNPDLGTRLGALFAIDHLATKGSAAAVSKIDELHKIEEGRSIWTQFRGEALPIQARLRRRAGG